MPPRAPRFRMPPSAVACIWDVTSVKPFITTCQDASLCTHGSFVRQGRLEQPLGPCPTAVMTKNSMENPTTVVWYEQIYSCWPPRRSLRPANYCTAIAKSFPPRCLRFLVSDLTAAAPPLKPFLPVAFPPPAPLPLAGLPTSSRGTSNPSIGTVVAQKNATFGESRASRIRKPTFVSVLTNEARVVRELLVRHRRGSIRKRCPPGLRCLR